MKRKTIVTAIFLLFIAGCGNQNASLLPQGEAAKSAADHAGAPTKINAPVPTQSSPR